MDISTMMEEYSSSGCESGWTIYFEQSRGCVDYDQEGCVNHRWDEEQDEEEEDSSMLSDASSGPAQRLSHDSPTNCQTNDNSWSFGNNGGGGLFCSVSTDEDAAALARRPKRGKRADDQQLLDDTASSSPDSGHSYSYSYSSSKLLKNDHRRHPRRHRSSPMDLSEDHLSASCFQGGGASTSSTAAHTRYDQVQFHHQQYHWY